jgi:hypothetical protein
MQAIPSRLEPLENRLLLSNILTAAELFANARPVDLLPGSAVTVDGALSDYGTSDIWRMTVPANGIMYFSLGSGDGAIDPLLEVYTDAGRIIRRNDNFARNTRDSKTAMYVREGQTFYVVAKGARDTLGSYMLGLANTPTDDIGNSFAAARTLANRRGVSGAVGKINYTGDVDVFMLTASMSGVMSLDFSAYGRNNPLMANVTIYDADQAPIAMQDIGGVVSFDVTAGQRYYLSVMSVDGSQGFYRMIMRTSAARPTPPPPAPDTLPDEVITTLNIEPGTSIKASLVSQNGLTLVVVGTNGADAVTIAQQGSTLQVVTASGTQSFSGGAQSIVIYGFGGNDWIRVTNSVTVSAVLYGGDGDDMLFDAGTAASQFYGQDGNDTLVSIGGGADTLYGGAGLDSLWADVADWAPDVSADENAVGALHRVASFYRTGSMQAVPLEIAGQNLQDPLATSAARAWKNFGNAPVFVDGPQYSDIRQGAIGDCYFVAVLASLSQTDPDIIRQMVTPLGDGTFAVRFYQNGQSVYLRVDGDLPTYSNGALAYAKQSATGEIWVPIVEKAYAFFRYGEGTYESLNGGWMSDPLKEITNQGSSMKWTGQNAGTLYSWISANLDANHSVTIGTNFNATGKVVASHAYMVKSVQTVGGVQYVTLYNPWGIDGGSSSDGSNDGLVTLSMNEVLTNVVAAVAANA